MKGKIGVKSVLQWTYGGQSGVQKRKTSVCCVARSTPSSRLLTFPNQETRSCCRMLHCYLCKVPVIPDAVFVVIRGRSDPL